MPYKPRPTKRPPKQPLPFKPWSKLSKADRQRAVEAGLDPITWNNNYREPEPHLSRIDLIYLRNDVDQRRHPLREMKAPVVLMAGDLRRLPVNEVFR